jgi:hypothetical protein
VAAEGAPAISVEFDPHQWLNPALLRNQRAAISRLVIGTDRPLRSVCVTITCDTGAGQSIVGLTVDLKPGPQPVKVDHLHFPVLYQLIDQGARRRWVNFTVRCTCSGTVVTEATASVLWMGVSEWLDRENMWHFIPAFVDPNADGVLEVLQIAIDQLKKIDPRASFDGYQGQSTDLVRQQVGTLFGCLRDDPFSLSYITVPPLKVFVPGESIPSGQRVRTPNAVIEHKHGTCHDLAILFASCLEHVGIHPLVLLKPGHTYVGYWTAEGPWHDFWTQAEANSLRLQQVPGRTWVIREREELAKLVESGAVKLFEATMVTNRNARFEESIERGCSYVNDKLDVAVDIVASRRAVQPL